MMSLELIANLLDGVVYWRHISKIERHAVEGSNK